MTTSIWSGCISNSQRASITSKPLFTSVAESTVIRGPMRQFGCARAGSGVMAANCASGVRRNGPPEAVSTRRRTSGRSPARRPLGGIALLLAIDRQEFGSPRRATAAITTSPAATRISLFDNATRLPATTARRWAFEPDDAHGGRDHDFGFGMRRHGQHSRGAVLDFGQRRVAGGAQAFGQLRGARGVGHGNEVRADAARLRRQYFEISARGQRHD